MAAKPSVPPEYTFGDKVLFTRQLGRQSERRPHPEWPNRSDSWHVWKSETYPGQPEPAPQPGIVIGRRVLSNGMVEYDYEAGTTFYPREYLVAWLVAYDLRRKPTLVLPEHLWPDRPCQVLQPSTNLWCDHRDSAGVRCENRTPSHTRHGVSFHTIEHSRAGNGYTCSSFQVWRPYDA